MELVGSKTRGSYSETRKDPDYNRSYRGTYNESTEKIEKWSYNMGYGDYIYILTFQGGVLKKIEVGGRGY